MTTIFKEFTLMESQKKASEEIGYTISAINDTYNEWKKTKRRRNAVNIVTTSVNKLTTINPSTIDHIHDASRLKLATIIMRCMDIPPWIEIDTKRITYRRLFPLIDKLQGYNPNTGTNGNLREVIMTRLSASITRCADDQEKQNVFVGYEPAINKKYLHYIFGDDIPDHVCKMQALNLPEDFDSLINTLTINHNKACGRYLKQQEDDSNE